MSKHRWLTFVSYLYLLAAVLLCCYVGKVCYPIYWQTMRNTVAGNENGVLTEAFSVFTEELKNGSSVENAISSSAEVFAYGTNPN